MMEHSLLGLICLQILPKILCKLYKLKIGVQDFPIPCPQIWQASMTSQPSMQLQIIKCLQFSFDFQFLG